MKGGDTIDFTKCSNAILDSETDGDRCWDMVVGCEASHSRCSEECSDFTIQGRVAIIDSIRNADTGDDDIPF